MTITLPTINEIVRRQTGNDLADVDGNAYYDAINDADEAIASLTRYIAELKEMAEHSHNWSGETGFCMTCGADGNV